MRPTHLVLAAFALAGVAASQAFAATPDLQKTRSELEKWVEFRQLISEEENDWRAEKETIATTIDVIKSELDRLAEELVQLDQGVTEADRERSRLNDDNAALKTAASAVSGVIGELEARVVALHEMFPEELKKKIVPLYQRIPKRGQTTRAGSGERLQNIVGVMSEVEKFNRTVSITSELQKMPSGELAQVDTVYLGLAVAFFANDTGTYGGVIAPSSEGWKSTPNPELAPAIRRALAVYRGSLLAEFVPLPVEIK